MLSEPAQPSKAIDPRPCPLCGKPNACGAGRAGACWCEGETFPQALLDRVPPEARGRACVCRECLQAFQRSLSSAR